MAGMPVEETKTRAVVVRRTDYREADRLVTLFSRDKGRVDALVRGARKPNSRTANATEPFVVGEFRLLTSKDKSTVVGFQLDEGFLPLRGHYDRLVHASYCLSCVGAVIQPGLPQPDLFDLLVAMLGTFSYTERRADALTAAFLCRFSVMQGFAPGYAYCAKCGKTMDLTLPLRFSAQDGGVCHAACAPRGIPITRAVVQALHGAVNMGVDIPTAPEAEITKAALAVMRAHVEFQLESRFQAGKLM